MAKFNPEKFKTEKEKDKFIESKWEELEDILFDEDDNIELYLSNKWWIFPKHTSRDEIWHWFDDNHSKGVNWLLYDYKPVN